MSEAVVDDIVAMLPPLLRSLEALAFIARHLNPPDFGRVMEAAGTPDIALQSERTRLADWPAQFAEIRTSLETASDARPKLATFNAGPPLVGARFTSPVCVSQYVHRPSTASPRIVPWRAVTICGCASAGAAGVAAPASGAAAATGAAEDAAGKGAGGGGGEGGGVSPPHAKSAESERTEAETSAKRRPFFMTPSRKCVDEALPTLLLKGRRKIPKKRRNQLVAFDRSAAWAAASLAIGTRNGEQLT